MKPHRSLTLLGVTLTAFISVPMARAADPTWPGLPEKPASTPWDALDAALGDAQSVLYLDSSCKVVAFLIPDPADIDRYVPKVKKLLPRWYERKLTNSVSCPDFSSPNPPIDFSDTTFVVGPKPAACKPGVVATDADLAGTICQIVPMSVANLIVLNSNHDPLLILDGQSAARFATARFPATYLAHIAGGLGCSPAYPSPCLAPKSGVNKVIGGRNTCVCQ